MPLDSGFPRVRLNRLVEVGAPRLILTESALWSRLDTAHPVCDVSDEAAEQPAHRVPSAATSPDNAAYLLFTSGSTGLPKGVLGTYGGLVNRLVGMRQAYRIGPGERVLQKAPLGFDVSLWELLLPVISGAAMVPAGHDGHRDIDHLHRLIDGEQVTVCHFVPSMLREFLAEADHVHDSVRVLLSGGEVLPTGLAETAIRRFPHAELFNQYGPTETTVDVTAGQVTVPVPARVPIGAVVPGVQGYVLDELLRPLPVGVPGELYVGGVQVARGYLGQPGRTAERFVPHPFLSGARLYATGDRVRWLPGGAMQFLGRRDDQVKIRGNRVEPGEIEATLAAHPGVDRAIVVPDPGDSRLLGYYSGSVRSTDLAEFCRDRLPEAMVPARLIEVGRWPLTANGKVDRAALASVEGDEPSTGPAYVAPSTPVQQVVADVFCEVLQRDRVGVHDSFLELGGHSLLAIRAISRIRARLRTVVRVGEFFESPTVAVIAELIERQSSEAVPALPPIPKIDRRRSEP
jgi:amino acid adenylation domain-containing protein